MAFDIPVESGYPDQTLRIELDGIAYSVRIYWNAPDDIINEVCGGGRWYMELSCEDFTINNIALVGGCDLFEIYGYAQLGTLFVVDTSGKAEEPAFEGLGDRWRLRYWDTTENEEFLKSIGWV